MTEPIYAPRVIDRETGLYKRWDGQAWVDDDTVPPAGGVPAGVICMWGGLLANIPSGWALCDGDGGRPDLRSKFIKGAAPATEPGDTGGSATHTHAGHSNHVFTQPDAHAALTHTGGAVDSHTTVSEKAGATGAATTKLNGPVSHAFTQPGQHAAQSHSNGAVDAHSAHDSPNSEPEYYTLAFIIKT